MIHVPLKKVLGDLGLAWCENLVVGELITPKPLTLKQYLKC